MSMTEIGSKMYLITKTAGAYADNLVISAHGGIDKNKPPVFSVKSSRLYFYSIHGQATSDLGISNFIYGGRITQRAEIIEPGGNCFDYSLSKYQGMHAGKKGKPAETYESIEKSQNYVDEYNQLLVEAGDQAPVGSIPAKDFDVLTIRNRWWSSDVTLKNTLEAVSRIRVYPVVHCYFCRSFI